MDGQALLCFFTLGCQFRVGDLGWFPPNSAPKSAQEPSQSSPDGHECGFVLWAHPKQSILAQPPLPPSQLQGDLKAWKLGGWRGQGQVLPQGTWGTPSWGNLLEQLWRRSWECCWVTTGAGVVAWGQEGSGIHQEEWGQEARG